MRRSQVEVGVAVERTEVGRGGFPWALAAAMLGFLSFNSGVALYQFKGDAAMVAFIATSYVHLVVLFWCLWLYRRTVAGSTWRNRLKASVWTLTTLLTFSFTYIAMGTAHLTLPVALLVWAIAAATGIAAFSAFFEQGRVNNPPDMLPPV